MSVVASLVPGQWPQLVQVVVDEAPVGEEWRLIGTVGEFTPGLAPDVSLLPSEGILPLDSEFVSGGYSWVVPGGAGVGDGGQLVLVDNLSPGNVPYVYTFVSGSGVVTSNLVTVPFRRDIVLQTLDGQAAVDVELSEGSLDLEWPTNVTSFRVPGRARPVVRYDVLGDVVSSFRVKVPMGETADLRRVLTSGAPIVYRFGAAEGSFDLAPVGVIGVKSVSSEAVPTADLRFWTLGYELIDNPLADVRLGAFTWGDFDEVFAGRPWSDFDAAFVGLPWSSFDTADFTAV